MEPVIPAQDEKETTFCAFKIDMTFFVTSVFHYIMKFCISSQDEI